jgi:ribosomal protein S21
MRGKVVVREGEPIGQALKRLRREVCRDREADKWPKWLGCSAKPSEKRHRERWLREMKLKWRQVWQRRHRKQLAKFRGACR